jgi:hypothetical protein
MMTQNMRLSNPLQQQQPPGGLKQKRNGVLAGFPQLDSTPLKGYNPTRAMGCSPHCVDAASLISSLKNQKDKQ